MAKKPVSKGKGSEKKKKPGIKVYSYYTKEGDSLKRMKKSCPKCGTGYFMAEHKNRRTCGRCGYAEFSKKE